MALAYSPLTGTLCIESAMAQSAHVLDLAAKVAVESRDLDGLMRVAQGWAEITRGLDSKPASKDNNETKVGF